MNLLPYCPHCKAFLPLTTVRCPSCGVSTEKRERGYMPPRPVVPQVPLRHQFLPGEPLDDQHRLVGGYEPEES